MASSSAVQTQQSEPRIPGVPAHHKLGASKNEAIALIIGAVVLALIALSFYFSASF